MMEVYENETSEEIHADLVRRPACAGLANPKIESNMSRFVARILRETIRNRFLTMADGGFLIEPKRTGSL